MNHIVESIEEVRSYLVGKPVAFESPLGFQEALRRLDNIAAKSIGAEAPFTRADRQPQKPIGAIGVLSLSGLVVYKAAPILEMFGVKSLSGFMNSFRQMMETDDIDSIVMSVNSPGGSVFGIPEAAEEIFQASKKKPVIAIADPMAASAAYWLASASRHVAVIPSGVAGSIGVFLAHQEGSKMEEQLGIKTTIIRAGKFKAEGNPHEALTKNAKEHMQSEVDRYYDLFTKGVARARGVKQQDVASGFGEGRLLGATKAVSAGLADWVGTFDDVIERIASGAVGTGKRSKAAFVVENEAEADARMFWTKAQYEDV